LRDPWQARNGVALDTSLTLEDRGVSAFCGDHRNNPDRHALAAFLDLVKRGRIARGSYLIVESLDRLSREDIIPALSLLLDLIQAGVRVVQLLPLEAVYDSKSNPMHLMMAIMELSRGHSESAMKSERLGASWQERRRLAAERGVPMTGRVPAWLRLVGGEWQVIESAAETVRYVYRLATDGHGIHAIVKRLNAEGVPVIGRGAHWAPSYVDKLLTSRAPVGELQPWTARDDGEGKERRKAGPPIAGYYPAIITDGQWHAARAATAARRGKPGRPARDRVNLFAGLLFDAVNGGTVHKFCKGVRGCKGGQLASYRALRGDVGCKIVTFPFNTFESAVLSLLREIDPREVLPHEDRGADKVLVLSGRLAEAEGEVEKLKARLRARYSDAVADVLEQREAEYKALAEELAGARRDATSSLGEAWGECQSLLDAVEGAPDQDEARVRLRSALRRVAEGVWCLFLARGVVRVAAVQVWLTGGAHRDYLIVHRPATGGAAKSRPSRWWARSLTQDAVPGSLDLRRREDAQALARVLEKLDLAALAGGG
jgi:DNA invertase Pin-like site-specific DNA recombinase